MQTSTPSPSEEQPDHISSQCKAQRSVNKARRSEEPSCNQEETSENTTCMISQDEMFDGEEKQEEDEAFSYVVRRMVLVAPKRDHGSQRQPLLNSLHNQTRHF
ncbi:hypothetical protein KSP40_PGU021353 [Platanthera guangdongensis]|uniref:Uncharacterized protein n=1 Tax=Platanthera guangdongensis TaxID=2320717 RepID=A0ABR2N2S5_9ASPA